MANRTLKTNLSVSGIKALQKQLEDYKKDLANKCEIFVRKLAEVGIETAKLNTGGFKKYIAFTVKTEQENSEYTAIMIASNTGIIKSEWVVKGQSGNAVMKSADVSPLLMVEFGSGLKAENPKNIPGVGTGTFPGSTHGNEPGWWYATEIDKNGNPANWHYSSGISPNAPMYKASVEIISNVQKIAREVFGR